MKKLVFLFGWLVLKINLSACSCPPKLTIEQEFTRSDLVIKGRVLGTDTVEYGYVLYNRKGIKVGRHRYSTSTERYLRVKMIIEKSFKKMSTAPDTVYILTSIGESSCGYPFIPFLQGYNIPESYYQYIIYADQWTEKNIVKTKKGRRRVGQIQENKILNTFFTDVCRRTKQVDENEIKVLSSLAN
jgi:hypothetical protein